MEPRSRSGTTLQRFVFPIADRSPTNLTRHWSPSPNMIHFGAGYLFVTVAIRTYILAAPAVNLSVPYASKMLRPECRYVRPPTQYDFGSPLD